MNEKIHLQAADRYFEIAEQTNKIYELEKDPDKRIALRSVAAQNYFYASVSWIESIFAAKEMHSFNHKNRWTRMWENPSLFSQEIRNLYQMIERDFRNKVSYRGENGEKYETIKKLAQILFKQHGK